MSTAPVFVVGTPRSGTTLTANILGGHSRLFAGGAVEFLEDIHSRRLAFGDPRTDPAARERVIERLRTLQRRLSGPESQELIDRLFAETDLLARLRRSSGYRELFSTFMNSQAAAFDKPRWVNHVPRDIFHLDQLVDWFPDARIVICSRHVLDFMVSYREQFQRAERRASPANAQRLRRLYHPVATSMLWRASMRVASHTIARWPERVMLSRYEDLVADPERQIARLSAFVGEAFEPAMLRVRMSNSSRVVGTGGIYTSSVGQWRSQLSDAEAWIALTLCTDLLRRLGYSVEAVRPAWSQVARWVATLPAYGIGAMRANAAHRGPHIRYLARRLDALVRAR